MAVSGWGRPARNDERSPWSRRQKAALLGVSVVRAGSREAFLARKGARVAADLVPVGSDAVSTAESLHLRSASGLEVEGLVRRPRAPAAMYPGAVLVGGIKLGKRGHGVARHARTPMTSR
jgi:hypothetical protein